jgi:6-phosphogluconate dehydrogenase
MEIGVVGLGRMGGNIARRLLRAGHRCVVYDVSPEAVSGLAKEGAQGSDSLQAIVASLPAKPRAIWVMLPAGHITSEAVARLGELLDAGDIVIDGGNTFWKDDIARGQELAKRGIRYVDVGTSGGVWGLARGYCMMIGGEKAAVDHLDPIFDALAPGPGDIPHTPGREGRDTRPERGYIHAGPVGAGHFVKMVHNGIEYGLMQAYAEGFDILRARANEDLPEHERFTLDMTDIAETWRRGSVISSWLLDLTASALRKSPGLENFAGRVSDSGEGRWTLSAAIDEGIPAPTIAASLFSRFSSRGNETFANKILSAMRFEFGGHHEKPAEK